MSAVASRSNTKPYADFSGVVSGFVLALTNLSRLAAISRWSVVGAGGEVATSYEPNPVFDLSEFGADSYDVTLTINDDGPTQLYTFNIAAPATDDVAIGTPIYLEGDVSSGDLPTDIRLTFPIPRAKDSVGATLVSPATVELTIFADGVAIYGPSIKTWGTDLGNLTDAGGDYLFTGSLIEGGSLSFDSQGAGVDKYKVRLVTQGANSVTVEREIPNPKSIIFYERFNGTNSVLAYGSKAINENISNSDWALADVQRYGWHVHQGYQRGWWSEDSSFIAAIDTLRAQHPNALTMAGFRWDLCWYGADSVTRPAWGSPGFPWPTLEMASKPSRNYAWADFAATELTDYVQDPANFALTGNRLRNPYNFSLIPNAGGAGIHHWQVRIERMDISNYAWLQHATDAAITIRNNINALLSTAKIDAHHVAPDKVQFAHPRAQHANTLYDWVLSNQNPGWSMATNSGGTNGLASWPVYGGVYEHPLETVLDCFEGSWHIAELLHAKDPTALTIYDPVYLHVAFGSTLRSQFESQCSTKYGMTATEAREYWRDNQYKAAALPNVIYMIGSENNTGRRDSVAELGLDYLTLDERNNIRDLQKHQIITYPQRDQWLTL